MDANLDLDSARAAFAASTDFTVGLEEEFAVLDSTDLGLSPGFEDLSQAAAGAGSGSRGRAGRFSVSMITRQGRLASR